MTDTYTCPVRETIKVDLEVLKSEFKRLNEITNKLDAATSKIVDMAGAVSTIITQHELRLAHQEEKTLNLTKDVDLLQKWKYGVVGAAAVIGYLIEKII